MYYGKKFLITKTQILIPLTGVKVSYEVIKYAVISPEFIWPSCAQVYSLAKTPEFPLSAFGLIDEGAIGQQR